MFPITLPILIVIVLSFWVTVNTSYSTSYKTFGDKYLSRRAAITEKLTNTQAMGIKLIQLTNNKYFLGFLWLLLLIIIMIISYCILKKSVQPVGGDFLRESHSNNALFFGCMSHSLQQQEEAPAISRKKPKKDLLNNIRVPATVNQVQPVRLLG